MTKPKLNEALEAALNALDPLVNAYAAAVSMTAGRVNDETKVMMGSLPLGKLKAAKAAADGLYKFYKCRR